MQIHKSSNPWTHTNQSTPEQATVRPAGAGNVASGVSSSSAPSGVLNELAARPTKRHRAEASAVRSTPASGAPLAPNGTSIRFPFALKCDDLPPNSHLQFWPADAPELQGATAQQPAFENAAVHEEPRAAANRPSTLPGEPTTFAELRDTIRRVTEPSPYPVDSALIARFVDSIEEEASSFDTAKMYTNALMRFSTWLRQQNKDSLQDLLGKGELKSEALNFKKGKKNSCLNAALSHLHSIASTSHGTVKIRGCRHYEVHGSDKPFLKSARSATPYVTALRAFSAWLHDQGKKGLCETGRLYSQTLMDDAKAFVNTGMPNSQKAVKALSQIEAFYSTGKKSGMMRLSTRDIDQGDHQLSQQYEATLVASGRNQTYANGQSYAGKLSGRARQFSAWLKQEGKNPMTSRLHDQTLDDDLNLYLAGKNKSYGGNFRLMLDQVRQMSSLNMQPHDLESRAESAESSYSSMFPPPPEGGWPQALEGGWLQAPYSWDLNMPAEEMDGASGSTQPES